MKKPSVVVFDLGKVLVDFDYRISSAKIAARGNLTAEQVYHLLCTSTLPYRLESGAMTTEEFFNEVRGATGFTGALEEFTETFADIFTEIPAMIQLQAALRARQIPTFIFSNTNDIAVRHIRQRYPFFGNFDGYVLSYEHGAMKPEEAIYKVVEKLTGRGGPEICYLDDRKENVEGGLARGWRAVLHEEPAKTRAIVEELLETRLGS
jgi:HAD superfamily hydrolase (TIGR01509 family)